MIMNEEKIRLKATARTPLCIGNGEIYNYLDYVPEKNKIKIIDINKAFEELKYIEKINKLSELIQNNIENNRSKFTTKELFEKVGITNISDCVVKEMDSEISVDKRGEIKQFINQNGKYYIPGSSIKGAIRTAYIFDYFDGKIEKLVEILKNRNKGNELVKTAVGNIGNDVFKYLLVSDSGIIEGKNFKMVETERYNKYLSEKTKKPLRRGNPQNAEVLKENSEFEISLTIKEGFPKKFDELKDMINNLTKTICDFEISVENNHKDLKEFYQNLKTELGEEVYLDIGFGSGYLSKTIYLLLWKHKQDLKSIKWSLPIKKYFDRYTKKKYPQKVNDYPDFPRTRTLYNLNGKYVPLGWIKLNE